MTNTAKGGMTVTTEGPRKTTQDHGKTTQEHARPCQTVQDHGNQCQGRFGVVELRVAGTAVKLPHMDSGDPTLSSVVVMFRSLPHVLFCVKRPDGSYQHANRAFALRCGKKHESEVIGCRAVDLFPAELARSYEAQDQAVLASGRPVMNQLELISRHDGNLGWFLTSKSPIIKPLGVEAVMVISLDLNAASTSGDALGNLAAVVDRVRAEPERRWRVSELAALSGLGIRQLERRMQRVLGVGAKQFLQMTRVDYAARLLTSSSLALGVIADQCGYYDQSQFSREFRSQTGLAPGKYRLLVQ